MNRYQTEQTSQTLQTVMIIGLLAGTSLPPSYIHEPASGTLPFSTFSAGNNYLLNANRIPTTYEPHKNFSTEHYSSPSDTEFETFITNFFVELSSNQEPLGHEFEQILFENLWDLYQS